MTVLGKNIRQLRTSLNMPLVELADKVEVSASFLSQVESGKKQPSVSTAKKIADYLNVSVSRLLGEEHYQMQRLVKAGERTTLSNLGDGNLELQFLSGFDPQNVMEACIHRLEPNAQSGVVAYSHEGQEIFFVLEGRMKLRVEDQEYMMEEGDCFYLNDCSLSHTFGNASHSERADMLCISNPPYFYRSGEIQQTRRETNGKNR